MDQLREGLGGFFRIVIRWSQLAYVTALVYIGVVALLAGLERLGGELPLGLGSSLTQQINLRLWILIAIYVLVAAAITLLHRFWPSHLMWMYQVGHRRGGLWVYDLLILVVVVGLAFLSWRYLGILTFDWFLVAILAGVTALLGMLQNSDLYYVVTRQETIGKTGQQVFDELVHEFSSSSDEIASYNPGHPAHAQNGWNLQPGDEVTRRPQ